MSSVPAPDAIGFLIVDLARLFRHRFERVVAAEGLDLTAGEARTLLHASRSGGIRQCALAERMLVEPMTLSRFLDRLEERGYVQRIPDPQDRRAKLVTVTPAAKPLAERIEALAARVRADAAGGLSARDVEALRQALQGMRLSLSDALEKDAT